jgi:hypothetical protein
MRVPPSADAWLARRPIAEFLKANPEWQIHWKKLSAQSFAQKLQSEMKSGPSFFIAES